MQRTSQWELLFDAAIETIVQTEHVIGGGFIWSFGGGTALMIQIDHRESHDVDLFVDDIQILPFLNPITQEYVLTATPDDYDSDGTRMIKLIYEDIGEIDFICCADITNPPNVSTTIRGVPVRLETPAEIVGKKIYYRGASLQPRDMFDVAAVARAKGDAYVVEAMRQCGKAACTAALATAERFDRDAATRIIERLMHRDSMKNLIGTAQDVTIDLLRSSIN